MLRRGITVTGSGAVQESAGKRSKWPTGAAGRGPAGPRQKGLLPGGSSQRKAAQLACSRNNRASEACCGRQGLWWPGTRCTGVSAGQVSALISRHRQQHWSLALALFGVAAAHGHGGGGRKQNRGKIARWLSGEPGPTKWWAHRPLGVLGSPPLAVWRHAHTGQSPS